MTQLVLPDIELVSAASHTGWMQSKLDAGITSRKSETDEELMVPYAQLSDAAKELNRASVRSIYTAIRAAASIDPKIVEVPQRTFKYYIADLTGGQVLGTDSEIVANNYAFSEDNFVISAERGCWIQADLEEVPVAHTV